MDFDHQRIPIDQFMGLYDRGSDDDTPVNHASDCPNVRFIDNDVASRYGLSSASVTISSIRRIAVYKRIGEASRLLILDNSGNLYDSLNLVTPILTIVGMTDFSAQVFNNRIFISPHNGTEGLPGEFIYIYDGTGSARRAGGTAPSSTFTVATSASSGSIEAGIHIFAIAFETASGYITPPGPSNYIIYGAPGGFKATVSSIPTGPTGVVARRILATKVIPTYNGNQDVSELFFVPGGRIPDNITTTLDVDFFDQDLQESAEYLKDLKANIPACLHLTTFKDRLVASNYDGGNSIVLVSRFQDPETFSELDNFLTIDPSESTGVQCAIEFRSTLYIFKTLRGYAQGQLEGEEPSSWPKADSIDRGAGTRVFGVSKILDSTGTNTDKFLIADQSGLLVFDGITQHPPLTFKVSNLWARINANKANEIQVLQNPTINAIYVLLPIDGATKPNVILYGDYSVGMDPVNIKWSVWSFPYVNICAVIDVNNSTQKPYLRIGALAGNVYDQSVSATDDNGIAINSYYRTGLIDFGNEGIINHIAGIRYRCSGSGLLKSTIYGEDGVTNQPLFDTQLTTNPSSPLRKANFSSPRASVKFGVQNFGETFFMHSVVILWKPLWNNG